MSQSNRLSRLVPDLPQGWYGYENVFGNNSRITLKNGLNTRKARCRDCLVHIPANVPRFHIHAPWRYQAGNYCIECGTKRIERSVEQLRSHLRERSRWIRELGSIVVVGHTLIDNEGYKGKMAIPRLSRQLER